MKELLDVLENYQNTNLRLSGKAKKIGTLDQQSLLIGLPEFFKKRLQEEDRNPDGFYITGSIGKGNLPSVPWVGVFNLQVTKSAQDGYYIVLLFSEDMRSCYLSLNQGVTAFERKYTRKIALEKMKAISKKSRRYLSKNGGSIFGPIDLKASGHLAEGYEQGAIESYRYELENLPSEIELAHDFKNLLYQYDKLVGLVGASLSDLVPVTEAEYQKAAFDKSHGIQSSKKSDEPVGPETSPNKQNSYSYESFSRDPTKAGIALRTAGYLCEIEASHETFISRATHQPYIEAHHLIPISQQRAFKYSLDVTENIVAVCPMCHRLLHFGRPQDKNKLLVELFEKRRSGLERKGIVTELKNLLIFYKTDLVEEDF